MHLQTWQNVSSTLLPRLDYRREVNILSPITNLCPTFSPHSGSPLLWWVRWEDKRDMGVAFSQSSWTDVIEEDEEQHEEAAELSILCLTSCSLHLLLFCLKKARGEGKEEEDCFEPPLCFPPSISYSSATQEEDEIRRAGAGDPGRCPGPGGSSSGLRRNPHGQPRGRASCRQLGSPETRLRAAPTRSQRWTYPAMKREKPVQISPSRKRTITIKQEAWHNFVSVSCKCCLHVITMIPCTNLELHVRSFQFISCFILKSFTCVSSCFTLPPPRLIGVTCVSLTFTSSCI